MGEMVVVRFTCYVGLDTQKAEMGLQQIDLGSEWGVLHKAQHREKTAVTSAFPQPS